MKVVEIIAKPFSCSLCSTRFATKKNIQRHIETLHGQIRHEYQCWFCKKTYQNKSNYNVHWNKSHNNEFLLYLDPVKVEVIGKKLCDILCILYSILEFDFEYFVFEVISPEKKSIKKKKSVGIKCKNDYKKIGHRTYGNPFNKASFAISTLERSAMLKV